MSNPGSCEADARPEPSAPRPRLALAFRVWLRIGILSFGGPAGQIALMHDELVDSREWLSEREFMDALSFCMMLPGPEAMQLATYVGWKLNGTVGGLLAGMLFVLPGAAVMLALSAGYALWGDVGLVSALFVGIKAAVIVIVFMAMLKISARALVSLSNRLIAASAFAGIFFLAVPFPLIILSAALAGFVMGGETRRRTRTTAAPGVDGEALSKTLAIVLLWLGIWWLPVFGLWVAGHDLLVEIGIFFSKLAVVTFGGAYAVLAYLGQDVVLQYGWLTTDEMMAGLGLAETTPGPLILVTELVGFLAAFRQGGLGYGIAGAATALWTTFAPCFLWILAGAPYIHWLCSRQRLNRALSAIAAAVVGVILNLSIWFALHVFFGAVEAVSVGPFVLWRPELSTLNTESILLALLCALAALCFKWGTGRIILLAGTGGTALYPLAGLS
ncbi:MAG: chromate efflux transporter [Gammaproteobacteria bacterium]|nr:chromate efflux transporter [Gammaproteobacteria bacterium]